MTVDIEKVIAILSEIIGAEEGELTADLMLFEEGLLDSFAVVNLLVEIEDNFGVTLDIANLTREEMATPALIAKRIEREANG